MSITIARIRVSSINITKDSDGKEKVTGYYELISNTDKVLAKQSFNGYSDIEVALSRETVSALVELQEGLKTDIQVVLGLKEGVI